MNSYCWGTPRAEVLFDRRVGADVSFVFFSRFAAGFGADFLPFTSSLRFTQGVSLPAIPDSGGPLICFSFVLTSDDDLTDPLFSATTWPSLTRASARSSPLSSLKRFPPLPSPERVKSFSSAVSAAAMCSDIAQAPSEGMRVTGGATGGNAGATRSAATSVSVPECGAAAAAADATAAVLSASTADILESPSKFTSPHSASEGMRISFLAVSFSRPAMPHARVCACVRE